MGAFLYQYHAFGLRITSAIELPELHPGDGPADVEILFRAPPQLIEAEPGPWFSIAGDSVSMKLGGMRYVVSGGRSIVIEAAADTPPADVRVWLLGTVIAALLHQRGYLPVHANVVALGEAGAAAFAGDSGAGKSTLAAWFESRGHRVLADDLCAIAPSGGGAPRLFEGIPRVKLWKDALAALGRTSTGLEKVASNLDKYHVPMRTSGQRGSLEPLQLERVYLLDRAAEGEPLAIQRITGSEAARAIMANAYRWSIGQEIQQPRSQFDQSVAVARSATVFRISRRWGMSSFREDAEAIEAHMIAPLGRSTR